MPGGRSLRSTGSAVPQERFTFRTPRSRTTTFKHLPLLPSLSLTVLIDIILMATMAPQAVIDVLHTLDNSLSSFHTSRDNSIRPSPPQDQPAPDALLFILPLLIVLSTFLFILLLFLVCVIFIRRRRGIVLRDSDGPTDMSREELIDGEGGLEGVESRWLESVSETVRRSYLRAKGNLSMFRLSSPLTHMAF